MQFVFIKLWKLYQLSGIRDCWCSVEVCLKSFLLPFDPVESLSMPILLLPCKFVAGVAHDLIYTCRKNYGGRGSNLVLSRLHELVDRKRSCSLKCLYIEPSNSSSMHSKNWKLYQLRVKETILTTHLYIELSTVSSKKDCSFCPYPIFVVLSM